MLSSFYDVENCLEIGVTYEPLSISKEFSDPAGSQIWGGIKKKQNLRTQQSLAIGRSQHVFVQYIMTCSLSHTSYLRSLYKPVNSSFHNLMKKNAWHSVIPYMRVCINAPLYEYAFKIKSVMWEASIFFHFWKMPGIFL